MQSSHGEQAANELQAVRAKIVQLEGKVADVEKQALADPALKVALLQQLPGLQQQLATLLAKEERLAAAGSSDLGRLAAVEAQFKVQQAQLRDLSIQFNKASRSTRTHRDLGAELRSLHHPVSPSKLSLTVLQERDKRLTDACEAVLKLQWNLPPQCGIVFERKSAKKRKQSDSTPLTASVAIEEELEPGSAEPEEVNYTALSGVTLADLTYPASTLPGFLEEKHMQPAAFKMLEAVAKALGCDAYVLDTHATGAGLTCPDARPDATSLADAACVPAWPQVVCTWEFKVGTTKTERDTAAGQLLQRSAAVLDSQPGRVDVIGVMLTMNCIEVFQFRGDTVSNGQVHTIRTDLVQFSVSPESPGFQLLVRVLCTPKHIMGFIPASLPNITSVEQCQLDGRWQLIRRGSGKDASHVFLVQPLTASEGTQDLQSAVVVKLNPTAYEAEVLQLLGTHNIPHTVRLLGVEHAVQYCETSWTAIAIAPFFERLTSQASLSLFTQVAYDVAVALEAAWKICRALQRDVTPNNLGHFNGRGGVYDWSAGKVMSDDAMRESAGSSPRGKLEAITGTLLWAPYSVLCQQPHTLSSQLEGLFISLVYIAANGHVHGHGWTRRTDLEAWAGRRVAQFTLPKLRDRVHVAQHLLPLVDALHDLFWPMVHGQLLRSYRSDVTCQEVLAACQAVCSDLLTAAVVM